MKDIIDIVSVVVTIVSLVANIITFIPRLLKWITDKRYLFTILSPINKYFLITQSLFRPEMLSSNFIYNCTLLTENSAISIQKVIKLIDRLKIRYDVFSTSQEHYDEIHIGGPISNAHTNAYINQFFPNFHFCDSPSKKENHMNHYKIHKSIIEYSSNFQGFVIDVAKKGQNRRMRFAVDSENDYMFLIKLTAEDLGCNKTVHLVFGGSDIGTLVAADFLSKYYKRMHALQRNKHYFFAVPVHKTNQTAATSMITDLTEHMFGSSCAN